MPKKPLKHQLRDALKINEQLRTQLNEQENHRGAREFAEGKVRLLEAELAKERHKVQALEKAEVERTKQRPMSDAELMALAATVLSEHGPKTEAQKRMTAELERRGVIQSPNPWSDILRRWGPVLVPGLASIAGLGAMAMKADAEAANKPETP